MKKTYLKLLFCATLSLLFSACESSPVNQSTDQTPNRPTIRRLAVSDINLDDWESVDFGAIHNSILNLSYEELLSVDSLESVEEKYMDAVNILLEQTEQELDYTDADEYIDYLYASQTFDEVLSRTFNEVESINGTILGDAYRDMENWIQTNLVYPVNVNFTSLQNNVYDYAEDLYHQYIEEYDMSEEEQLSLFISTHIFAGSTVYWTTAPNYIKWQQLGRSWALLESNTEYDTDEIIDDSGLFRSDLTQPTKEQLAEIAVADLAGALVGLSPIWQYTVGRALISSLAAGAIMSL